MRIKRKIPDKESRCEVKIGDGIFVISPRSGCSERVLTLIRQTVLTVISESDECHVEWSLLRQKEWYRKFFIHLGD